MGRGEKSAAHGLLTPDPAPWDPGHKPALPGNPLPSLRFRRLGPDPEAVTSCPLPLLPSLAWPECTTVRPSGAGL